MRTSRAFYEDLVDLLRALLITCRPFGQRREKVVERVNELLLDLDVAHLTLTVAVLEILDLCSIRIKGIMVDENRVALHRARDVR